MARTIGDADNRLTRSQCQDFGIDCHSFVTLCLKSIVDAYTTNVSQIDRTQAAVFGHGAG
jgi:hypothetical protein